MLYATSPPPSPSTATRMAHAIHIHVEIMVSFWEKLGHARRPCGHELLAQAARVSLSFGRQMSQQKENSLTQQPRELTDWWTTHEEGSSKRGHITCMDVWGVTISCYHRISFLLTLKVNKWRNKMLVQVRKRENEPKLASERVRYRAKLEREREGLSERNCEWTAEEWTARGRGDRPLPCVWAAAVDVACLHRR